MTIYLDVILLENLCMNYIILFATGFIIKAKMKQRRLFLSALIGAIYAMLSALTVIKMYTNVGIKILLSITMIYLAFRPENVKKLGKELLLFYLVSFAFGGCAFALLYFVRPQDILMKNGVLTGTYPLKIALLGGIVGFVTVTIAFRMMKTRMTRKNMFCEIEVYFREKKISIKAMIDTGNLLKEPITQLPVIVIEKQKVEELIPKEMIENLIRLLGGEQKDEDLAIEEEYTSKFRVIPFSSLGKQNGLLIGFKADKVKVKMEEEEIEETKVMVGIYQETLTKNGAYSGLIGLDLIERCERDECFADLKS